MLPSKWKWSGPFRIDAFLERCLDEDQKRPPESGAVYLISRYSWSWSGGFALACHPLYVGGNTGGSKRFRTRIGDVIADMHGLFGRETGHSSGGQSLYSWCREKGIAPGALHLAWATWTEPRSWCDRCAEIELYENCLRHGLLNKMRPGQCKNHSKNAAFQAAPPCSDCF